MKKLSIDILSNGYPVINQEEMLQVKGGVSEEEFLRMLDDGTWTGGHVDGWGYVADDVVVYGAYANAKDCHLCGPHINEFSGKDVFHEIMRVGAIIRFHDRWCRRKNG